MRWEALEGLEDFAEFLDGDDEVEEVRSVEVQFDDGAPTGVIVTLKDGRFVHFCAPETDCDGVRQRLYVSITTKENEDVG